MGEENLDVCWRRKVTFGGNRDARTTSELQPAVDGLLCSSAMVLGERLMETDDGDGAEDGCWGRRVLLWWPHLGPWGGEWEGGISF